MRFPVEVWILVWILWTQIPSFVVGVVYNMNDFVPLVDATGTQEEQSDNLDDTQRTELASDRDPSPSEPAAPDSDRGTADVQGVQGPLRGLISMEREAVQCVELRSKRYISDGFCTSIRPITEVVCAGTCIPNPVWYSEYIKTYGNRKRKEWRCVNDNVRQKKVTLLCDNDATRTYRIKTVRSCKCKRITNHHNQSHRMEEVTSRRSNRNRRNRNVRQ